MDKRFQVLNILGYLGVLAMNYLAVSLPLNGQTPGEISDRYPTLFTPAGFTFSIWSIIYLLLLVFVVKQAKNLFKAGQPAPDFTSTIGPWFILNCVANSVWLVAWHHEQFLLALAIMLAIFATLLQIYMRLGIGQAAVSKSTWFGVHLPFSVYIGWITVATIANVSVLLVSQGWSGFGMTSATWAVLMVAAGTFIGMAMLLRRRDLGFGLVLVWAFFGIWSARKAESPVATQVVYATLTAIILLSITVAYTAWKRLRV